MVVPGCQRQEDFGSVGRVRQGGRSGGERSGGGARWGVPTPRGAIGVQVCGGARKYFWKRSGRVKPGGRGPEEKRGKESVWAGQGPWPNAGWSLVAWTREPKKKGMGVRVGQGRGGPPRWEQGWCRPGAWSFGERKPGRASVGAAGPKGDRALHGPGIEPGPPAWQARILPLNHPCTDGSGQQTASPAALPSGGQTRVGASREHLLRGSRRRTGGLKKRLQARPEP